MKTKYNMTLKQPYFDLIKAGKKTVELRLYDEKRRQIKVGDEITFQNGDNFHTVISVITDTCLVKFIFIYS